MSGYHSAAGVREQGRRWPPRFAVVGAGNGGHAMAAHLAAQGASVALYNRTAGKLETLVRIGRLRATGAIEAALPVVPWEAPGPRGEGVIYVTDRIEAAARADVLMITVPATGHAEMAQLLAPHVREGQLVVLNPGRTLGAIEVETVFGQAFDYARPGPTVAEAQSLLYAARVMEPGHVHVFSIKKRVPLAAIPAWRTEAVLEAITPVFPQFVPAESVLHTSLDNIGAIFHPAPVILNLGRVEGGESFDHYHQGITPSVAGILEAADAERLAVARALGVNLPSARQWLELSYGCTGDDLYQALQRNEGYAGIKAPLSTDTRYLWEDVPTGLVPLASLGEIAWVPTPTLHSLIHLASLAHGTDYYRRGRTLSRLGLDGIDLGMLQEYVLEGRRAA